MPIQKKKNCIFAPPKNNHFNKPKKLKNYVESVRNRFHYDARFI
jgi:hypothetical protein